MQIFLNLMSFSLTVTYPEQFHRIFIKRYSNFAVKNAEDPFCLDIQLLKEKLPFDLIVPAVKTENEVFLFERYDMCGRVSLRKKAVSLRVLNNIFSLDTAMRVIFSYLLLMKGGFLIHSSSVLFREFGIIFLGVSGSGKTTISHLSKRNVILSDEISAVSKIGRDYFIHGNSFFSDVNEIGPAKDGKLSQIYILHKAPYNKIESSTRHKSIQYLLRNIMSFDKNKETSEIILRNVIDITNEIYIDNMFFLPDTTIYDEITLDLENKFINN